MAITAQSIIRRATDILQDKTSIRWTSDELVRWLNDGQREVAMYRPDAFISYGTISLVTGTRQSLPAGAFKLVDLINNAAGAKSAIRQVPRRLLDEQNPEWHGMTPGAQVKHYTYDPRDPRTFFVFPPVTAGTQVNGSYAVYPTDVTEPTSGTDYTSVTGNIGVPDIFAGALLDYVLYRGYSKNSDYAGDAARATAHYAAFANALGIEVKATMTMGPVVARQGELAGGAV